MTTKAQCWIFAAALLLCAVFAHSQVAVTPWQGLGSVQFFDNNGQPLYSGVLYSYQAGTTTQQATYADPNGITLNANPMPFSSGARATLYLISSGTYKFVLCSQNDGPPACAPGDVLFSVDQVPGNLNGASTSGNGSTFTGTFISGSSNPATTGILRLASGDSICWRTVAGTGNLCISKDLSDVFTFAGGVFKMPEGTCSATGTGFDYLCADVASHHFAQYLNGGTKLVIPGVSAQGTFGHLASFASNGYDLQDSGGIAPASTTVAFTAIPTFTATSQDQLFQMTLTGNVTGSTLVATGIPVPSLLTFELTQDATGGRTFVWPGNFVNAFAPNTQPNFVTVEQFMWDGSSAWFIGNPKCTVISKSANYTATAADCIIQASASGGSITLTMPQLNTGQSWAISRIDTTNTNTLTIQGSGGNVNAVTNIKLGIHMTTVCHSDGTNLWCTNPGAEYTQSTVLNGCSASSTCTFTYPIPYTTLDACVCSGEGGSCNVASKSTTACTINTSGATPYDVIVTGIP